MTLTSGFNLIGPHRRVSSLKESDVFVSVFGRWSDIVAQSSIQLVFAKDRLAVMLPMGVGSVGFRTSSKMCL